MFIRPLAFFPDASMLVNEPRTAPAGSVGARARDLQPQLDLVVALASE